MLIGSGFLLRELLDVLLPYITPHLNATLEEADLPGDQKWAIVRPALKKSGIDPDLPSSYRSISNLTCFSKLFERVVTVQTAKLFGNQWSDT